MAQRENELDAEIRALYRGSFDEFIAARNALAVRLRKEKRTEDAARVKPLPKPTPSAWAVNLLFEREAKKMADLLAAGETARSAQSEAVSGGGAEPLRQAIRDARRLADELRWDAARLLSEGGRSPSRDVVERIAANLQALAFSPAAAEEAARGWLDRDLDPPGFEVLAGLQLAGSPPAKEARKEEAQGPAPARPKIVRSQDKAKEDGERKKREAAEQARRRIALAEEKAEQARAEAKPLRKEAEQAERAAAEARRQAEEAEKAAARARERYEQAAERLARAEEALREARKGE